MTGLGGACRGWGRSRAELFIPQCERPVSASGTRVFRRHGVSRQLGERVTLREPCREYPLMSNGDGAGMASDGDLLHAARRNLSSLATPRYLAIQLPTDRQKAAPQAAIAHK